MDVKRKPFQGVYNIIRFNWHFYFISGLTLVCLVIFKHHLPEFMHPFAFGFTLLGVLALSVSLLISFYIYDLSDLYHLKGLKNTDEGRLLNINAGFDEISEIIKTRFPKIELTICDFYNAEKHTEISIQRARKAYPPINGTFHVSTHKLPFKDNSFEYALAQLSAHEIRDSRERVQFFKELNRVTKTTGLILVTEHLRDWNNFMVYSIGFFHFHSKSDWLETFKEANLKIKSETKVTPFITTFTLENNGDTF